MAPIVLWIVVALGAALVVILVAGAAGGRSGGMRQFLVDIRAGLRRERRSAAGGGFLTDARRDMADAADVETSSVDEIFEIGVPQQNAYLGTSDITETLSRAASRARGAGRP